MEKPEIPNFKITEHCGSGSSSDVWVGIDENGVARAIKVMDRSATEKSRNIEKELKSIAEYRTLVDRHPHLLHILYFGTTEKYFYFVMDLADNVLPSPQQYRPDTLAWRLRNRTFSDQEIIETAITITEAVLFLHHPYGIGHCDLKPGNILYVNGVLKLGDPGLISPLRNESYSGTAGFRPPWKCTAAESDIYAIGKIIYCMYSGLDADQFPSLPRGIDLKRIKTLNDIVCRCCEPSTDLRYRAAGELLSDLQKLEKRQSWPQYLWRRRSRIAVILLGTALLASLTVNILLFGYRENYTLSRSRSYELLSKAHTLNDQKNLEAAYKVLQKIRNHYFAYQELDGFNELSERVNKAYFWQKSLGRNSADSINLLPLFDSVVILSGQEKQLLFERTLLMTPTLKSSPVFLYHYLKLASHLKDRELMEKILRHMRNVELDSSGLLYKQLYLIMTANHFLTLGELDTALLLANDACAIESDSSMPYLVRAHLQTLRGQYAEAMTDLQTVKEKRPDSIYLELMMRRIPAKERQKSLPPDQRNPAESAPPATETLL